MEDLCDLIVTDPPYYDAISYGFVMDFLEFGSSAISTVNTEVESLP